MLAGGLTPADSGSTRDDPPPSPACPGARAALVVAHPGHELLVHGWLEQVRPVVFVLTDGSGRTGESRLAETAAILGRAGARAGRSVMDAAERAEFHLVGGELLADLGYGL